VKPLRVALACFGIVLAMLLLAASEACPSTFGETVAASALLAGANFADYQTTRHALATCPSCMEGNPLLGKDGERVAPAKLLAVAAGTAVFVGLRKSGHKRGAWIWVASVVVLNLAVAAHNRQVSR
jgi:hypothetical protein